MMMRLTRALDDLLFRLQHVAYPTLREEYAPQCCIAAAAILTRIFDIYGYRATVIPVSVMIVNAQMAKILKQGIEIPDDPEKRAMFFDVTKAWGVGICPASAINEATYGGHLLLRVKEFLVDTTIKQAERPLKFIHLPEMIVCDMAHNLCTRGYLSLAIGSCVVTYTRIQDESYRTAPDWRRRATPFPETVRKIIQRVEAI
jgi:hypothetical protein